MPRRTTKPYDDKTNPIWYCPQTQSSWYKGTLPNKYRVLGVLIHDTGCNNDMLRRYIQPSDNAPDKQLWLERLGKNRYSNDWNHVAVNAGLGYWVGRLDNGLITSVGAGKNMTDSCTRRQWGCGAGSRGSLNSVQLADGSWGTFVQWEICEDGRNDKTYFKDVWEESVALTAAIFKKYGISPYDTIKTKAGVVLSVCQTHWSSYLYKYGSGHYDWNDWTDIQIGKVNHDNPMKDAILLKFQKDVADYMKIQPTPTPTPTPTPVDYPDTPFLIKVKAPVDIYADSKGKKKTGKKVDKVGVYTIVECNEPDGFGLLKSKLGWVDLKCPEIYIRGEGGDEMKFSELKELYYRKGNIMKGDAVEIVQAAVNTPIDGSFGPNTEQKVKEFQRSKNIVNDGIVGEETWRQIWNLCKKDQ